MVKHRKRTKQKGPPKTHINLSYLFLIMSYGTWDIINIIRYSHSSEVCLRGAQNISMINYHLLIIFGVPFMVFFILLIIVGVVLLILILKDIYKDTVHKY